MKRRDFVLAVGAAVLAPSVARAQQPVPVIGLLVGRHVEIEHRFAEGRFERLPELAAELIRRKVAVIVAIQSARAPLAAKAATATIPVVFAVGGDPVRLGLVPNLNRPGGNVTGASFLVNPLGAKRLELLRELMPSARTVGLLVNPNNPAAEIETRDLQEAARHFGQQVHVQHATDAASIDAAFADFAARRVDALTFAADAFFNSARDQLVALAARHALPTVYFLRDFAEAGGLMSYSGSADDAYRLAGFYAGRILKGEKPGELPVQQSVKLELVINLKTAKALGLDVPVTLVARADEVIE